MRICFEKTHGRVDVQQQLIEAGGLYSGSVVVPEPPLRPVSSGGVSSPSWACTQEISSRTCRKHSRAAG
jgi:hypothetical protein